MARTLRPSPSTTRAASLAARAGLGCLLAALCLGFPCGGDAAVRLALVGDVLLDRGVAQFAGREGWDAVFADVAPVLRSADLAVGNLECPVTARWETIPKLVRFRASPDVLPALVHSGLDVLSLANNHSTDCGREGLVDTMRLLEGSGIRFVGAGGSEAEAERPVVVRVGGVRIAFVGFSDWLPEGMLPRADRPAVALASEESVRRAVTEATSSAEVVIASFHWGVEFAATPTPRQRRLARAAVEAGASVVVGHHPHVLQGLEWTDRGSGTRPCLVAYSLGNFVFDQQTRGAGDTAMLLCDLTRGGLVSARLVPFETREAHPTAVPADDAARILSRLDEMSRELGARVKGDGEVVADGSSGRGKPVPYTAAIGSL